MWRTPFSTCHSIPMCGRSSAAVLQRARLRRGTLLPPHACGFRGGRDAGHLSPPLRALRRSDGARRPGAHSSDGGVRGWQLPHGAVPRARRGGNALVPGMGAGRGRLVSHRRHCAWFHVFDFACGQLQWLGLRSCRFHVGAGAFGAWLCLWEITRVFGRTTWYRLLLLPSTCWRPVTWWKDVRLGFGSGLRVRTSERNFLCRNALFLLRWLVFSIWPFRRRV